MMPIDTRIQQAFQSLPAMLRLIAQERPEHLALVLNDHTMPYAELDRLVDAVAASLQRDGLKPGDAVAICASTSLRYVAVYFGTLRAGGVVAPLPTTAQAQHLSAMLDNSLAQWLFIDHGCDADWSQQRHQARLVRVAMDDSDVATPWANWLVTTQAPAIVESFPDTPFNLIYSSGTTGTPKGIMQPHSMRWSHTQRAWMNGYRPESVVITGTPLYSNTTLVAVLPSLAIGATVILMDKFDAQAYLKQCHKYRATHTMLVPIQYQRILAHPDFDRYDLSSFKGKFSTSAPFSAQLMAQTLARWPGELTEIYGMTEGGGRCELAAHLHPDKLHTVGKPASGCDIRIIGEDHKELEQGQSGEIVGRSPAMMQGYYRQDDQTGQAQWFCPQGLRFIRTGDIGYFDEDGFLVLSDRKKDMLISGGFNIYPKDLEAQLSQHPYVLDCAVIGAASERWGETPVGFVVLDPDSTLSPDELLLWVNTRVGKIQRLSKLLIIEELPRNPIGKVLKRDLRDAFVQEYGVLV